MKGNLPRLAVALALFAVLTISMSHAIPLAHAETLVCQTDPIVTIVGWNMPQSDPIKVYVSVALSPTNPLPHEVKIHLEAFYKPDATLSCDQSQFRKIDSDWEEQDPVTYTVLEKFKVPNLGPGTYLFIATAFADGAFLGQSIVDPREGTGP